ncbi:hypothetical protein TSUD_274880 [Trifolium subterraneum]|uniref:Reverse transcriptase zinc-binding domain-containing protein n=1 Tax=Trifolium subterraneum TaxID=3900 RepID=A0A2Z6MT42_TRISU|nr:hypothetical protein TSUD_274880 [Trifolium subterraneum]
MAEMFSLGWGKRRGDHSSDRRMWQPDLDDGYIFRGAYQLLTAQDVVLLDAATCLIWHYHVSLKVSIFAWRLLQDKLPTKANSITRGILPKADHLCVSGCGAVESAQHLFLSCSTFRSIWHLVSSWIGSSLVTAQTLSDHFVQFATTKPHIVQRLGKPFTSYVGQDQDFFL